MAGAVEGKVGRVGGAGDLDAVELAGEVAGGVEDAGDSVDGVEVGVIEGVFAGDGGVAGDSVFQGPKLPTAWISPLGMALESRAS